MIDWTKPLELMDGTPLLFAKKHINPDSEGDYFLVREDGEKFTSDQIENWSNGILISRPDGREWDEKNASVIVRNREPATMKEALKAAPTLRDQFAMAALTGIMTDASYRYHADEAVVAAYRTADLMLEARK